MFGTVEGLAAGSARNWRLVVVGAGFEEVELLDASGWIVLLDAVDYGGLNGAPAGRFLDVSGWVGVLFPPPQAEFREFLLKPSLFVMRRSEDRPEFDWPCRT